MGLVDPGFPEELERFGVSSAFECFNCGSCAAICPLIDAHFPRKMIRYAQLGAKERILQEAPELWRCLHCGLCTQTCPRGADPGGLILGLRRFALDHWRRFRHV
jgi:heterodisulfide reductase subunit C2